MASNYSLQVENVRFDPTRLLALEAQNIANAETEHRAAEAAYGEIQSKADMFEKLANDVRGKNSQAYQNYINYANTLRQHTDLLATQGVNPALWRNLLQAKSDYSRIIHPIEEAYQARDKEAERQAKYLEQHPHAMFERDAYDMGIDQWMKNPHYRAKSIDREVVANRAMERYKALQNQIMEMVSQSGLTPGAIKKMTPTQVHAYVKQSAPWLYEAMEKRGVSPEEVQRFMTGDSTAINSLLTSVMDETLGMYGLNTWNTDYDHYTAEQNRLRRNDINNILRSTVEGEAPNAIGESKFTPYTDSISGDLAYKYAALEEQKRHNKEIEARTGGGDKEVKKDDYANLNEHVTDFGYNTTALENDLNKHLVTEYITKKLKDKPDNALFSGYTDDELTAGIESAKKKYPELDFSNEDDLQRVVNEMFTQRTINDLELVNNIDESELESLVYDFSTGKTNKKNTYGFSKDDFNKFKNITKKLKDGNYFLDWSEGAPKLNPTFEQLLNGDITEDQFNKHSAISAKEFKEYVSLINKIKGEKVGVKMIGDTDYGKKIKDEYNLTYNPANTPVGVAYVMADLKDNSAFSFPRFLTSIGDATARKNFARVIGQGLRTYQKDGKSRLVSNADHFLGWKADKGEYLDEDQLNKEMGYDKDKDEYTITPVIWMDPTDPDHLKIKWGGEEASDDNTFLMNTYELSMLEGFRGPVKEYVQENARVYKYLTSYGARRNMSQSEKNKYLKYIKRSDDVVNNIIINAKIKGYPTETPAQIEDLILKGAMINYAYALNHDAMNTVVRGGEWSQGSSDTTPEDERKAYQFMYENI